MAVGCYTPKYLQASFKGVAFESLDTESSHGRRGAEGEFPFGESTAYADLGIRIKTYSIKARFASNDHIARSSALIAACESKGPGILIHPTRGAVRAGCKTAKAMDNPLAEQGVSYVQLEFVEANEWISGNSLTSFIGGLPIAGILSSAKTSFISNYSVVDAYYFRRDEIRSTTSETIQNLIALFDEVSSVDADLVVWKALREMNLAAQDEEVLSNTEKSADLIAKILASIDAKTTGQNKLDVMRRAANASAKTSTLSGIAGASEDAVYALTRIEAAAYMARGAMESTPLTLSDAFQQHDIIVAILKQEAEAALAIGDNLAHLAIRKFLSEAQAVLLNRAYTLPAIVQYNFGSGVNSLVAAYAIFDDAKRFREIETRNNHQFPWAIGPEIVAVRS